MCQQSHLFFAGWTIQKAEGIVFRTSNWKIIAPEEVRFMNVFKLDLMTVLFVVVLIGVVATMTTQANDHAVLETGVTKVSASGVGTMYASKRTL